MRVTPNFAAYGPPVSAPQTAVQFGDNSRKKGPGKREIRPPGPVGFSVSAAAALAGTAVLTAVFPPAGIAAAAVTVPYAAKGTYDIFQTKHSSWSIYPVWAHLMRWGMEGVRDVVQQDILEGPLEGTPIDQLTRIEVYQMSKDEPTLSSFGTQRDVYASGFHSLLHSAKAVEPEDVSGMRVTIGGPQCKQPYSAARVNISAMSYGSISRNAVLAMNQGAKMGNFFQDTGEGGISYYHLGIENPYQKKSGFKGKVLGQRDMSEPFWSVVERNKDKVAQAGDLVWEIGTGYFGVRDANGKFDWNEFEQKAKLPNVKMIELKLSQGAKPGGGGNLPAEKNTEEIAAMRGLEPGTFVHSPPVHDEDLFKTPVEMMEFLGALREKSGGKPVGFKLCIGNPHEFIAYCKAMVETGIVPDFITVDGSEGATGAAHSSQQGKMGVPLRAALPLVHNALTGYGLRDKVKVVASGKLLTPDYAVVAFGLGADLINTARGFMLASGCLQTNGCHKGDCPAGIATQKESHVRALRVPTKAPRVFNYQKNFQNGIKLLLAAAGVRHPDMLSPEQIMVADGKGGSQSLLDRMQDRGIFLEPGALLPENIDKQGKLWQRWVAQADANSFEPVGGFRQVKPNTEGVLVQLTRKPQGEEHHVGE